MIEYFSIVWILLTVIFMIIELNTKDIFFLYFSISSTLSFITSLFNKQVEVQLALFIICSLFFIVFIKTIVDKMIESNFKIKGKEDGVCIVLKEESKELFLYKVLTKRGVFLAKYVCKRKGVRKFQLRKVIHDDGKVLLIK